MFQVQLTGHNKNRMLILHFIPKNSSCPSQPRFNLCHSSKVFPPLYEHPHKVPFSKFIILAEDLIDNHLKFPTSFNFNTFLSNILNIKELSVNKNCLENVLHRLCFLWFISPVFQPIYRLYLNPRIYPRIIISDKMSKKGEIGNFSFNKIKIKGCEKYYLLKNSKYL